MRKLEGENVTDIEREKLSAFRDEVEAMQDSLESMRNLLNTDSVMR